MCFISVYYCYIALSVVFSFLVHHVPAGEDEMDEMWNLRFVQSPIYVGDTYSSDSSVDYYDYDYETVGMVCSFNCCK